MSDLVIARFFAMLQRVSVGGCGEHGVFNAFDSCEQLHSLRMSNLTIGAKLTANNQQQSLFLAK